MRSDNLVMWSLIVGAISPHLTALVQQPKWSKRTRTEVAAGLSILYAAPTTYFSGGLDGQSWSWEGVVTSSLVIGVASITAYQHVWKNIGTVQAVESASSPASGKHARAEQPA